MELTKDFAEWALEAALRPHPTLYGLRWAILEPAIAQTLQQTLGSMIVCSPGASEHAIVVMLSSDHAEAMRMLGQAKALEIANRQAFLEIKEKEHQLIQNNISYNERLHNALKAAGMPKIAIDMIIDEWLESPEELKTSAPKFYAILSAINKNENL